MKENVIHLLILYFPLTIHKVRLPFKKEFIYFVKDIDYIDIYRYTDTDDIDRGNRERSSSAPLLSKYAPGRGLMQVKTRNPKLQPFLTYAWNGPKYLDHHVLPSQEY